MCLHPAKSVRARHSRLIITHQAARSAFGHALAGPVEPPRALLAALLDVLAGAGVAHVPRGPYRHLRPTTSFCESKITSLCNG